MQKHQSWRENKDSMFINAVIRAGVLTVVTMACFYSAVWMVQDVFPDWKLSLIAKAWIIVLVSLTAVMYESGRRLMPKMRYIFWGLLQAVCVVMFYRYAKLRQIDLEDGACALATQFLDKLNSHLKLSLSIWRGKPEWISMAFAYWSLVVLLCLLVLTLFTGKRILLLLLPIGVLGAELFIGYTPQQNGLILFFVGLLFLHAGEESRRKTKLRVLIESRRRQHVPWYLSWLPVVCLAGAAIYIIFLGSVLHDATGNWLLNKSPQVIAFQKNTEQRISDLWNQLFVPNQESILSRAPKYTGKEMFKITSSRKPAADVLLRGFCGTEYKDGRWVYDTTPFTEACQQKGVEEEETARDLLQNPFDTFSVSGSLVKSRDFYRMVHLAEETDYTIEHTGMQGEYAYLPYFIDYSGAKPKGQPMGDVLIEKERGQKQFTCKGWMQPVNYKTIERMSGAWDKLVFQWYDEFAKNTYLDTSDKQRLQYLIEDRVAAALYRVRQQIEDGSSLIERNQNRLLLVQVISNYLFQKQTYSMQLEAPPNGEDPMDFFLKTSHKGYCVHFASAAVLLCRELGIPARYVSGYVARAEEFQAEGDSYIASVKDSSAHAWVEIYLERIGWIPMDVTPGSGNAASANNDTQESVIADTQSIEEESQAEEDTQAEEETQTDEETQEEETTQANQEGVLVGQKTQLWKRVFFICVAGLLFFLAVYGIVWQCIRSYHGVILRQLKAEKYRIAVRQMNQRIYRKMCRQEKIHQKNMSDAEYEQRLKIVYPEVFAKDGEYFMQIARKAAFAKDEVAKEEALFCYQVYCMIYSRQMR